MFSYTVRPVSSGFVTMSNQSILIFGFFTRFKSANLKLHRSLAAGSGCKNLSLLLLCCTLREKTLLRRCFSDIKMTCVHSACRSMQLEAYIYEQEPLIRACVSSLVTLRDGPHRHSLMIITKSDGIATGQISGDPTLEKKH